MSWIRTRACGAMLVAVALASAGDAATLVVRSVGPSAKLYPPGKPLADDAKIVLKANDTLTLLDAKGTRTLTGPGLFGAQSAATATAGMGTALAALANGGSARRARIGAVRGAAVFDPNKSPNVWFVDASQSATICVADPAAVTLWHAGDGAATATITGPTGHGTATFLRGQNAVAWPASLPVTEGASYTVTWAGTATPAMIRFALVGAAPTDLENIAATLIRRGCGRQLDMLIETVAVPAPAKVAG